jgi:hypothetical protein
MKSNYLLFLIIKISIEENFNHIKSIFKIWRQVLFLMGKKEYGSNLLYASQELMILWKCTYWLILN